MHIYLTYYLFRFQFIIQWSSYCYNMCSNSLSVSNCYCYCIFCYNTHTLTKRKDESTPQDATTDKVLYEQVHSPSPSITKNDPKCQRNPAYGVGGTIVMDTNPAYASCM